MSHELHKAGVLRDLPARREPYWGPPLEAGRFVGYRKLPHGGGTWIARYREKDGSQSYKSLGQATDKYTYARAKRDALVWFKQKAEGVAGDATVESACKAYVEDLRTDGRDDTAHGSEMRFTRYVYGLPFGAIKLDKLTTADLKAWRAELPGTKATQNRYMVALRAALNFAVSRRMVAAERAIEWRSIKQHKNADGRRTLYLDLEERRRLILAAAGSVRDLIEAAVLTGARPGELVALKVGDFDARTASIAFAGKTGRRDVPLSPAAVALFKRLSKSKLPSAPMLTNDDGDPWTSWSVEVRDAVAKAKLPSGVSLYVCRHSWITSALQQGMSTLDVARLTGTSLVQIERHYGHLVVDSARERLAQVVMV